jgi:NADH-quinone oxidoreductase subunit F
VHKLVGALERGEGCAEDIELLVRVADNMQGNTICLLADACAMPTRSIVSKFRDEFTAHVELRRCPMREGGGRQGESAPELRGHADA